MSILNEALELVYPSNIYCIACGNLIDKTRKYSLCDNCIREINWATDRICEKCGRPLNDNNKENLCANCLDIKHSFTQGYVCAEYDDSLKDIILNYKYRDQPYIASAVAEIMRDRLGYNQRKGEHEGELEEVTFDMITSVPLHRKRRAERGYNQAELIAKKLAKLTDIPYRALLERTRYTASMKSLGLSERRLNLEGAFRAKADVPRTVLLIDDVLTTGSTADACAEALLLRGASRVDLMVFAAGASINVKI